MAPEALSVAQARAARVGLTVAKRFKKRLYHGKVKGAAADMPDKEGVVWPLLYHIRYENGYTEHLTPEELEDILVDKAEAARRLGEVLAGGRSSGSAAHGRRKSQQHAQHEQQQQQQEQPGMRRAAAAEEPRAASGDENDENAAGGAAAVQPKRRQVLGDATERSRNVGPERRSRRDAKRRLDENFAYEDPRGGKRAAADDGGHAIRARLGLRQPGTQGGAAELAELTTESEVPYPVGEGGMRVTGLPGHVKSIEVINFMCHEHLKMDFANHVTFISGTNGSGKSAVLQALQCCLGVKASSTGRTNTFKKLIRSGTDEAVIRVTVWNKPYKGHDAFRHGVFGDTITVERRISQNNNSSAYTLKDAAGRVHGRRRDDLDSMLTTLGLNAANPVCVMTQDTARNFLAGSSSKADQEKYQLYMEATSLEQIAFSLQTAKAQIRQMEEGVEQIREEYDKMCTEHAELKKSIAALEGIQGWRAEVAQLEQVLCWSVVEEHASTLTAVQAALDSELPRLLAEAEGQLGDLKREQAALTEAVEGKSKFLTSYNERSIELLAEQDGLRARHREAHRAVKAAELKLTSLREALTEAQAQKENLESAAREVQDDTFAATQAAVAEYQRQLQEAQEAQDAVQQEAAHLDAAHRAAQDSSKAAHQRAEDVSYQRDAAQRHMQALERDIVQLRSAGRNKLAGFGGQPAVRLVEAIKRASGQFSRPPIGPLGVHLALEDPTWGLAVESAIGRFLESYLVNSMEDSRLLRRMIDQHFQGVPFKPTVYVARFDLPQHTVPPAAQPPPSVPTVYRLLSCTDRKVAAPVMNILVDLAHIEKTALGSDLAKCKQAGWETPNVVACFSIDGEKFYRRGSTTTVVPRNRWVRGARLGQSAAQQASELEAEAAKLQEELGQLNAVLAEARNAVQAANGEETCARKALQHARREEWEAKTQLTQLTQQPPPETLATQQREGGDDVQADIWEATQACIEVGQQLRDKQAALEEASEAWRASGATIADNKAAMDRLEEEHAEFAATYEPEVQKRSQVEMQVQEVEEYAEQLRCKQALYQQRCQQMVEEVTELEGCAAMVCSREEAAEARCAAEARLRSKQELSEEEVAALLSKDLVEKKMKKLERRIAESERAAGGSLHELQAQYAVSQARMQREGRAQREVLRTYQVLHEAAQLRTRKLQELDHNLEALVNTKFRHYMWKKGHSGTIKLDRKARSLQLQVRMNAKQIGGARGERGGAGAAGEVRDLKQLSGGERSYTTVAFTLALGGQTEMPFRAMDEFDVFMDAVNRRVAMQNLFSFARDNPELQFIFLSPQDMAAVEDARQACLQSGMQVLEGFVRVVQMRPPRANAVVA